MADGEFWIANVCAFLRNLKLQLETDVKSLYNDLVAFTQQKYWNVFPIEKNLIDI